jgi:hypothetical protein
MSDPTRWLDDPDAPDELKQALRGATRAGGLDRTTRDRVGVRVGRLAALPLSAVTWLSLKSAAALGLAGGATVAGTLAVVEHYRPATQHVAVTASPVRSTPSTPRAVRAPAELAAPAVPAPSAEPAPPIAPASPTLNPPAELPRGGPPPLAAPSTSSSGGLAEESALLEQARRALDGSPSRTLALVHEHAMRFRTGQLAAERSLLEVDALYRLGRRAEARALAERLLAAGGGDLYVGRVERLLQKIDGGR